MKQFTDKDSKKKLKQILLKQEISNDEDDQE
jgi:hypothetical protein